MPDKKIVRNNVRLTVADGTTMGAYVARPAGAARHPGLLVLQEAFGVNAHIRSVTERLARQGYVALAPELFHRTAPRFEGDYNRFDSVMPHVRAMTAEGAEADLRAAFDWLQSQKFVRKEDISSIGFCMGGRISFLANTALPLRAAVSFYGGGIAPSLLDRAARLHARMLFFWGELDQHIRAEERSAVIAALKANRKQYVNVEFSDAGHGFFCDARPSFQPVAARESWALMLQFLRA